MISNHLHRYLRPCSSCCSLSGGVDDLKCTLPTSLPRHTKVLYEYGKVVVRCSGVRLSQSAEQGSFDKIHTLMYTCIDPTSHSLVLDSI